LHNATIKQPDGLGGPPIGLDGGDGGVDILGDDISAVHEAAGHVVSVTGVALGHHASGLKDTVGDFGYRELQLWCGV